MPEMLNSPQNVARIERPKSTTPPKTSWNALAKALFDSKRNDGHQKFATGFFERLSYRRQLDANSIAQLAFNVHESRDRPDARDVEDWLHIEEELGRYA